MTDTIAAIATAPGQGGVGIVRVSGPIALRVAAALSAKEPVLGKILYTQFIDHNRELLDQGLLLSFKAPHSYTGEDVAEFQIHGGPWILQRLLDEITNKHPVRLARPGEFTERAFLNGKLDLAQAEAVADLIAAGSEQAARAAQRSLNGVFSQRCEALHKALLDLRMRLESAIDFPEEEIDFLSDPELLNRWQVLHVEHQDLLKRARQGARLNQGLTVVLAGAPNVGKSSLLNALSERDAAIVSPQAGTTRDILQQAVVLRGVPVTIIDTAGLRDTDDYIEREGVKRARAAIAKADFLLHLQARDVSDQADIDTTARKIEVLNKIDLSKQNPGWQNLEKTRIHISAKTGAGLNELIDVLVEDSGESEFSSRQRHVEALQAAGQCLQRAGDYLKQGDGDIAAEELRLAQQALGEITGQVHNDDLLGHIFSSFCIGK